MSENARDAVPLVQSPFCAELRSKKFFLLQGVPTEASQYIDGADSVWCYKTQLPIGPDGGKAYPNRCVPGRPCYCSSL
jgi:hypothetical protein